MIIGIDGNEANVKQRVGSNRYALGIIWALYKLRPKQVNFIIYLKEDPMTDMPLGNEWWRYKVIKPKFAWTQWRLPLALMNPIIRPNVFFSPGHYAPRWSPVPTVVSVMDLAFLSMPKFFLKNQRGVRQLAKWTEYSVKQATGVIAISKFTKNDIEKHYGIGLNKIHVAYPGLDKGAIREENFEKGKYILHLGTVQPRKNIIRLIKAFELLPPKYKAWQLWLVGQNGWMVEEIDRAINISSKKNNIKRMGYVDQAEIQSIIAKAACLVMVGLHEGFGMPAAEALLFGTIPVVANNTSLPEVTGAAGIMVDPYSIASIKHGIITALTQSKTQKDKRIECGREWIKRFDWQVSAKIILKVLYDVAV